MLDPSRWAFGVGLKASSSKECFKFGLEAHRAGLYSPLHSSQLSFGRHLKL